MFTGEENLGRYLDLHLHHDTFNNLSPSANKRLAYIAYIDSFDKFDLLHRSTKSKNEYDKYVNHSLISVPKIQHPAHFYASHSNLLVPYSILPD